MYNQFRDGRNGEKGQTTVNDVEEGDQRTPCSVVTIRNSKDYRNVRNFDDLQLNEELLRGIHTSGYETPPPVLQKALIPFMKGYDVIVNSWPEANERMHCSVLALQKINTSVQQCQVLILAPSAQQAEKTQQAIANLGRFMHLHSHACHDGKKLSKDSKMAAGAHIVVGTPDRLYGMIQRKVLITAGVKLFVLQDADRMLFKKVADKIYNIFETLESKAQVLLLTSFLEEPVFEKCRTLLRNSYFIVTSKADPMPGSIRQVYVPTWNNSQKREILYNFYRESDVPRTIIFCNKTKQAKILENKMRKAGITASALHGGKTRKEKNKIIEDFCSLSNSILITTDAFVDKLPQKVAIIINFNSNKRNYYERMCKADPSCEGVIINFSTLQENGIIEKFYKTKIALTAPLYGVGSLRSYKSNDEYCVVQGEEHEKSEKSDSNFPEQIPKRNIKHFYISVQTEKLKRNILHILYTDLNIQRAVIFCNGPQTVRDLEEEMIEKSYPVLSLHNKTPAKKRQLILEEFDSIYDRTLITNDSLRNNRVQQVPIVIYYDYYRHKKVNYTRRIRTDEWFSPQGIIINFVKKSEQKYLHEMEYFRESKIQRLLGYDISTVKNYNLECKRDTTPSESKCTNLLQNLDTNPDSIIEFGSDLIADSFEHMNLSCELLQTISGYGLAKPTAFQQKVITLCLLGHSVIIHARQNKGRKIALAIAALQRVDLDVKSCQQLILASTTDQIMKIQKVISTLKGPVEAYCERCVMGSSDTDCVNQCKVVAQIAMGTPKFAEDRMHDRNFTADKIKMFILYEAEKLLSEEYREEIFRLYGMLNRDVQIILLTSNITTDVWESPIFMRDFIYITP